MNTNKVNPITLRRPAAERPLLFGTRHSALGIRAAFTFIEVLFAVIILGVGMIMIAGMLPVAIKQNADTRNDLTARAVTESGYAYLRTLIATHPEAFPETIPGDSRNRNVYGPTGAVIDNETIAFPLMPTTGVTYPATTRLREFLRTIGSGPGSLNGVDFYTANTPALPPYSRPSLPSEPVANPTFQDGLVPDAAVRPKIAGRVVPLTLDVITAELDNRFRLENLLADTAGQPDINDYPIAWHQTLLADRILSSDGRFQWMAFYRRDEGSKVVKLIIVAMRLHNRDHVPAYRVPLIDTTLSVPQSPSTFQYNRTTLLEGIDLPGASANDKRPNGPFLVPVEIEDNLIDPDLIKFVDTSADARDRFVAETGSFVIIAHSPPYNGNKDDAASPGDLDRPFRNNGRVFQLGQRRTDLDSSASNARVWELRPGYDLPAADAGRDGIRNTPDDRPDGSMNTAASFDQTDRPVALRDFVNHSLVRNGASERQVPGTTAWAWIIGKGRADPSGAITIENYTGPTQDLAVLTVDVPLP